MTCSTQARLPDIAAIQAAADRLRGAVRHTPLLESPLLNARLGFRLLVKPECLQLTGSFKLRGAYNRLARLKAERPDARVVAFSSGNHAQGVARAGAVLGLETTIVMPPNAPAIKIANTKAHGATIVHGADSRERQAVGERLAAETGAVLVPPYDDPDVIAGQGTVGLEIADDLRATGTVPDAAIVCCGGGGLSAGVALALRAAFPDVAVYAAEPEGFDDTRRSLKAGERLSNAPGARTICDAIMTPTPGALTFEINRRALAGGLAVSDAAAAEAMRVAFRDFKLVAEPGGAVALAAALAGGLPGAPRTVVAVISGGNVDAGLFARVLAGEI